MHVIVLYTNAYVCTFTPHFCMNSLKANQTKNTRYNYALKMYYTNNNLAGVQF